MEFGAQKWNGHPMSAELELLAIILAKHELRNLFFIRQHLDLPAGQPA
jgi:hypothetical protein